MRSRLAALAFSAFLTVLAGCGRRESPADAGVRTQTLLLGNAAEPADLDPPLLDAWTDTNICYALFEGLTEIDETTTKAVPATASSWDVSADGLTYTFHLRPEARWSNGDPVTADDFAFSYQRVLSPGLAATYSYMLWPIRNAEAYNAGKLKDFSQVGVRALDAHTLQITLSLPTPYLPELATHNTWLPVHRATIERYGRMDQRSSTWTRPGNLVGNGPFALTTWVPNGKIVVDKNPNYYGAAKVRLNRIVFYPIEDRDAEDRAYRAGQIQVTYELPTSRIAPLRRDHPDQVRADPWLATYFMFLNTTRPPLDNPKVRRALAMAVDREAICRDVLMGSQRPVSTFTPANFGDYTCRTPIPTDFSAARKLLAEAGYPGGRGFPTLEALTYNDDARTKICEAIQNQWQRELGIHISILAQEQKTLFQNQKDGNYALGLSGWAADYPDVATFMTMMVTGGGNNWAKWSNATYDRLVADAAHTVDNGRRFEDFQKAEAILLQEAPLIPIYQRTRVYAKQPYVRGWPPSLIGFDRFKNVWLEK